MTTIFFVRHAQPDYGNHSDAKRPLTEKGMKDREKVTEFLMDKAVDAVLSSPYKRSVDTVKHFADTVGLSVCTYDGFRERKIDSEWIEDFDSFCRKQWSDFSYKLSDGESLGEVQARNIEALKEVLSTYRDKTLVIGTHGTALSTIINYYNRSFGYGDFCKFKNIMPYIVTFTFDGDKLLNIELQ